MTVRGALPAFSRMLASHSSSKSGGSAARIAATSSAEKRPGRISRPSRRKASSCSSLSFTGPLPPPVRGLRGAAPKRDRGLPPAAVWDPGPRCGSPRAAYSAAAGAAARRRLASAISFGAR